MNSPRQYHNVVLAGFMGTGKSSVGRLIAEELRFDFVDTDILIEGRAGKRVADIFAQEGEPAFRRHEQQVVEELAERRRAVISVRGGVIVNPANLASLKSHSLVVCLWAAPETIWQRTRAHSHRPLLSGPDPQEKIRSLLAEREPFYRQADVLINTDHRNLKEVAHHVLHEFGRVRAQASKT